MDFLAVVVIQLLYGISVLALISFGLALTFGMMRVINLAHGEFLTLGGYAAIHAVHAGINPWIAMLVFAPLAVAAWSLIVERLVIRWLYGRIVDTMLATWGLSLAMVGGFSMIFGNTTTGFSVGASALTLGAYQVNGYSIFVVAITVAVAVLAFLALFGTVAGRIARAAIQNPEMTQAFGYPTGRIYMLTFVAGGALAGLAGGVLAPVVGITPASGGAWIAKAFITVISGGAAPVLGTIASSGFLGFISQGVTLLSTPSLGDIALLVAALILLRILPTGISSLWRRSTR